MKVCHLAQPSCRGTGRLEACSVGQSRDLHLLTMAAEVHSPPFGQKGAIGICWFSTCCKWSAVGEELVWQYVFFATPSVECRTGEKLKRLTLWDNRFEQLMCLVILVVRSFRLRTSTGS